MDTLGTIAHLATLEGKQSSKNAKKQKVPAQITTHQDTESYSQDKPMEKSQKDTATQGDKHHIMQPGNCNDNDDDLCTYIKLTKSGGKSTKKSGLFRSAPDHVVKEAIWPPHHVSHDIKTTPFNSLMVAKFYGHR